MDPRGKVHRCTSYSQYALKYTSISFYELHSILDPQQSLSVSVSVILVPHPISILHGDTLRNNKRTFNVSLYTHDTRVPTTTSTGY